MLKLIKKINSHGTTVIFTTQILEEIDLLCDYVAILYNESISDEGSLQDVLKKYELKNMSSLFTKILSKKGRKAYLESAARKSEMNLKEEEQNLKNSNFLENVNNNVNKNTSEDLDKNIATEGLK
jgi:ABC-type multidrug transport system ATPase subunit